MREVMPGIWQWSWFSAEKQLDFNGLYVRQAGEALLVDPPPFTEGDAAFIERHGRPGTIVLTNRHHGREAIGCRAFFGARLLVPEADSRGLTIPFDATYAPSDRLPCGFVAVGIAHSKTPGETALHHARRRILVLGDALIGKPPGEMSFLPDDKFPDAAKAREGIRVLLDLDFEALLVGDGVCLRSGGKEAVRRALAR